MLACVACAEKETDAPNSCIQLEKEAYFQQNGIFLKQQNRDISQGEQKNVSFVVLGRKDCHGISDIKPYGKDILYDKSKAGQKRKAKYESNKGKEKWKHYEESEAGQKRKATYESEKGKEKKKHYEKSEAGQKRQAKYESDKGKDTRKYYEESDKGKDTRKYYEDSEAGKKDFKI